MAERDGVSCKALQLRLLPSVHAMAGEIREWINDVGCAPLA